MYHRTLSRQNLQRFPGRAQKIWDQVDEYASQGVHCVKQTSLSKIQVKLPHQHSPYAMTFEDRSPGETARQERCARGKLKKEDKATFYSPVEEWIMPAASTIKREGREFVVDSGTSMHMVSWKDLNKIELETVWISKNPTSVVTANGEVLTK